MAVAAKLYGSYPAKAANKEIDFDTDDIRVMLLTNAYTPDQDVHDYLDDVVANEVSGTGYTAGGAALTTKTVTYTAGTNTQAFDADDVVWNPSTVTARYAVIYSRTPATNATRPLIGYVDFGADVSTTGAAFTITWNAAGIYTIAVA